MARERPTASAEQSMSAVVDGASFHAGVVARADAPRRCAPLSPSEFRALGPVVERGTIPLQALLEHVRYAGQPSGAPGGG